MADNALFNENDWAHALNQMSLIMAQHFEFPTEELSKQQAMLRVLELATAPSMQAKTKKFEQSLRKIAQKLDPYGAAYIMGLAEHVTNLHDLHDI